jgi:ABC-2 type transport system ATP-binding protein
MTAPPISTRNLTCRFGSVTAVDSLNLEIGHGEIFGLVGPDGAGKSTALRMICGLTNPTSGEAIVAGHDVVRERSAVKAAIGYMPQTFSLYSDLTIDENLRFYANLRGVSSKDRNEFVPELLRMTALAPFRSRPAGKLSGGMKQKLALMCTLLHRPRILVLDEPTNGLDPISRRDLWFLLYNLAKTGTTLLVSTAYMDEAARCHRVGLMDRGRLILCDAPERLRNMVGEECYEIIGPDRRSLQASLRSCEGVISVERCGRALHLFGDPARTSRQKLLDTLQAAAIDVTSFESIVPSLEDVFIATVTKPDATPPDITQPDTPRI